MRFDAKSLHFRVLVPSLAVIAAVFFLLLFITSCPADTSHWLTLHPLTDHGILSLVCLAALGCLLMAGGILLISTSPFSNRSGSWSPASLPESRFRLPG